MADDLMHGVMTLEDGTVVHFRPVVPEDEPLLLEAYRTLSPDTIYHRFFQVLKDLPAGHLHRVTHADPRREAVIVAEVTQEGRRRLLALGRYMLNDDGKSAEIAFVVCDQWQHKHLGTHLLEQLIRIARSRGIERFTADVLADNVQMMQMLRHHAPGKMTTTLEGGVYRVVIELGVGR